MRVSWLESPRTTGMGQLGRDKLATTKESREASAAESPAVCWDALGEVSGGVTACAAQDEVSRASTTRPEVGLMMLVGHSENLFGWPLAA